IGVQSFNNKDLTFLSRIHNSKQAIKTINDAYEIGFDNINIDLIFNLPEQTKEKWLDNLSIAVDLPINHISTYALIVEKNTPLYKLVKKREVKITEPDYDAELYSAGIKFLRQNKFLQYEVSNFAREGYECKHNLAYWTYKNYLGFGPAAHSFFNGYRWNNFRNVEKYSNAINKNDSAIEKLEKLSDKQKLEEFVMLSLRSKGLDLFKVKIISDKWENENKNYINQLIENEYLKKMKNILRLTDRGYAVCDEILLKFNYF
ncbi:MAG: coproporphyrinogen III oxidase family protein, partial [Ignavibacteriales bacterium]|nr:coproporphyrinogen III oxidase family protein [Ignavibacteriales bacterium]